MAVKDNNSADAIADALGGALTGETAAAEVARRLLEFITTGNLEPGTRLPPERQLATSLGVGRSAVREALAALDILGIVTVRPGSGTYLRGTASELLPETLSWGLMLSEGRTRDLIEIRHSLEVEAARLAARRFTPESVELLAAAVDTMHAKVSELPEFVEADLTFHQEVAEASGNEVLRDMLQSVRSLLRVWVDRVVRDPDEARIAHEQHTAVLNAIRNGNVDEAGAAMDVHMITAGERLLRIIRV